MTFLDGDGSKIHVLEGDLKRKYTDTVNYYIGGSEIFEEFFNEEVNGANWAETFGDGFSYGFSYIKDEYIVPRAYYKRGSKYFPALYDSNMESIQSGSKSKLNGKNIAWVFDEEAALTIKYLDTAIFTEEDAETFKTLILVGEHLESNDDKRGAASIADTGLFDFKIK